MSFVDSLMTADGRLDYARPAIVLRRLESSSVFVPLEIFAALFLSAHDHPPRQAVL
jgi:hypothetical protein